LFTKLSLQELEVKHLREYPDKSSFLLPLAPSLIDLVPTETPYFKVRSDSSEAKGESKKALKEIVKLGQEELKAQKIPFLLLVAGLPVDKQQLQDES
jgi:hypothetical protein